ncbi:hypothetical protein ABVK25_010335 [Lepraria finkii]|uniref:Uncharacterized protein n=1 Tax=Lepraria finkii TaxID=1340010 RepID=A0ABR4AX88_9LECA
MWRMVHKDVWSVAPIPQPVGLTEEEKKVFSQLCNTEIQKLKVEEARAKERERRQEISLQNKKPRKETLGKQRSEWSKRHDFPKTIVGEDLWKDIRHG